MEGEGAIGAFLDFVSPNDTFGEKTWENAERKMVEDTLTSLLEKSAVSADELDFITGGDLLNQCTATSFGCAGFHAPFLGLYGACSTFVEGLLLSSILLEANTARLGAVLASSHFSSAERQYRFPLEYGCQRTPTSQRTVTGCGAALLRRARKKDENCLAVVGARIGKIVNNGVKDANHMGAAMAPAAADTLVSFLKDSSTTPADYDWILTGDLGAIGATLFCELCAKENVDLSGKYLDCGTQMFSPEQDVHAGASGCACAAVFTCGRLFKTWKTLRKNRILLLGTGALLSPMTLQQKQPILGIAHLVFLKGESGCSM